MTPEDLVDIEKIRQLKARYFRTLDQKKWDEWEAVFCEDATIDTSDEGARLAEPLGGIGSLCRGLLVHVVRATTSACLQLHAPEGRNR